MPDTSMRIDDPMANRSPLGPRLRAGRGRIYRHALSRGAVTGLWTTLPISVLLWSLAPQNQKVAWIATSLILVGMLLTAILHWSRVRHSWPRIWDSSLQSAALVETIVFCHRHPIESSWHEALRARSSQLPLPESNSLVRLAPFPSPLWSLLLVSLALILGSWPATTVTTLETAKPQLSVESPVAGNTGSPILENPQLSAATATIRSREDAALALSGRSELTTLKEHLRLGSEISSPTSPLQDRDLRALETALGRLHESDPRRDALEQWLSSDRLVDGATTVPVPGLEATGEAIAHSQTPGINTNSSSVELADGGTDVANRLESPQPPDSGSDPLQSQIRLQGGSDGPVEVSTGGRSPSASETTSAWDRVRDDPRLEPRWIVVIDLYKNLLRMREQNGER